MVCSSYEFMVEKQVYKEIVVIKSEGDMMKK